MTYDSSMCWTCRAWCRAASVLIVLLGGTACASQGLLDGCIMTCAGPGMDARERVRRGLSPRNPSDHFAPLRPTLHVGEKVIMTFGSGSDQRAYRGYWASTDRRVIVVRQWRGACDTICAEVEAVASGNAEVWFRFEGGLMDWSNAVHVE
jgi:hypothetical protein